MTVDVADSNFSSNKADRGGAVFVQLRNNDQKADNVQRSQVNIVSSSFTNNEARAAGQSSIWKAFLSLILFLPVIRLKVIPMVAVRSFWGRKARRSFHLQLLLATNPTHPAVVPSIPARGDVANNSGAGLKYRRFHFYR